MASLADLIELIGREETVRLIEAYGGGRLYVPRARHPDLDPLLGSSAHARLVSRYGGERLEIPPRRAIERMDERERRAACVRDLHAAGLSYHEIARRTGVSRRQVARLLRTDAGDWAD